MTSDESSSKCSDSISSDNFSIYKGSSSLNLTQTSSKTVIFAGKAYLKINLLVKMLLHEFMAVDMVLSKYQVLCVLFHNSHIGVRGKQQLAINPNQPNDLFPSRLLLLKSRTFRNEMILPYLNFKTVFSYKTSFLYSLQNFETIISYRKLTSLFSLSHATKCHALDFN